MTICLRSVVAGACLCAALLLPSIRVASAVEPRRDAPPLTDNAELKALFDADQRDREKTPVDWSQVTPRDDARRQQVRALLAAGKVRTANDYQNAAFVFQHGDGIEDIRIANALATLAMTIAPDDHGKRWITAASWDRLMVRGMQPQWYATQYNADKHGAYLFPVSEDAISDAERKRMTGHTLAEARAQLPEAAKMMGQPVRKPAPTLEQLRADARADAKASTATAPTP